MIGTVRHPAWSFVRPVRVALVALSLCLALPALALASGDDDDPCPDGLPKVADLGIRRIEGKFDRGFTRKGNPPIVRRVFRFYEEPRITDVDPNGPAAGKLREGDVLVAVDDALVTTSEAGRRIGDLNPGGSIKLTVRRDGRTVKVAIQPRFSCPEGELADLIRASFKAPRAREARMAAPVAPTPPAPPAMPAMPAPLAVVAPRSLYTRGWFGVGLNCGECGFRYDDSVVVFRTNEYPEIYSVDSGSPADQAGLQRGDKLMQIDGVSVLSDEGSRLWGAVKPGQTVRWTFERDGETKSVKVTAAPRPGAAADYARRLESMSDQLRDLQRQGADADEMRRRIAEMNENLRTISITPRPSGSPRLRWSGSVGNADVTVRGVGNVQVTTDDETGDIVIVTGDGTTVRIKKSDKK